jgi:predicted RNase H-like HicB family nuclease
MEQRQYLIIIEGGEEGSNYSAYSPDVEGCVATGDSLGECIDQMRSALAFHLEGMLLHGEEVPEGSAGHALYVTVPVPEVSAKQRSDYAVVVAARAAEWAKVHAQ